jgi:(p)ppGpp synthase/HD superfamily hydrolase
MHNDAELGVCAHWAYKHEPERNDASYAEKLSWLRQVLEWHEEVGGFAHVGREIRSNIEDARIFVATPGGHVIDLPDGATPLDFAFRVHTDVGIHCVAARVDGRMVRLNSVLATGQRVEIDTDPHGKPDRNWLDQERGYIRTPRARAKIQAWYRALPAQENIDAGRVMLQQAFDRLAVPADFDALATQLGYPNVDRLAFAVAVGERQLIDVIAATAAAGVIELPGPVELEVACTDRAGMLHDLTAVLAHLDLSLVSIQASTDPVSNTATIRLGVGVGVGGLAEIARLIDHLQDVSGVISLRRVTAPSATATPSH